MRLRIDTHRISAIVPHFDFSVDLGQIYSLYTACGPGEIFVNQPLAQPKRFENLRAAVALDRRNAHLRQDFDDPFQRRFDVVVNGRVVVDVDEQAPLDHLVERFHRQVGVDGGGAETDQQSEVMDFARLAGFDDDRGLGAGLIANQVVVQARSRQQRGNRRDAGLDAAV